MSTFSKNTYKTVFEDCEIEDLNGKSGQNSNHMVGGITTNGWISTHRGWISNQWSKIQPWWVNFQPLPLVGLDVVVYSGRPPTTTTNTKSRH